MQNDQTLISIIIPHFNGLDILRDCLQSLYENTFKRFITILIDNGSTDGSPEYVRRHFPQVLLVQNEDNKGYSGACNQGMEIAETPFILLLNNDTVMPDNFLREMLDAISSDERIAMVQPKILSIQDKSRFDYSGGAGGELDILGYPFARGRIFDTVEEDTGQYDKLQREVFWTSGCALLLKKSVVDEIGMLDMDFFAHQEEIDLNWRAQLAGYKCITTSKTYIYHYSGYTLRSHNEFKMYLNHRNNLIMMIKNYSLLNFLLFFPPRILLEVATILADFLFWERKRARAVIKALFYIIFHPFKILGKRFKTQKLRKVSDRIILKNMYRRSVVLDHFIKKRLPVECVTAFRQTNIEN